MSALCSTCVSTISCASRALIASPRARCSAKTAATSPMSSASSGALIVCTKSWRRSATRQPSALVRPGRAGTITSGSAEFARERHRMQRPGAAEGEQREVARIVAARQRHHADRAGHVRVGERGSPPPRPLRREMPSGMAISRAKIARTCSTGTGVRRRRAAAPGRAGRAPGWRR